MEVFCKSHCGYSHLQMGQKLITIVKHSEHYHSIREGILNHLHSMSVDVGMIFMVLEQF